MYKMNIIIGCSSKKRSGKLPAYIKYNGSIWQTLRATDRYTDILDRIYVISALHGIIAATTEIDDYDCVLTSPASIDNLASKIKDQEIKIDDLIVVAGEKYRRALDIAGIRYTYISGGIGIKRSKLKNILNGIIKK